MRSLSGEFSKAINLLVVELTDLRALTEATLDFPEEDIDSDHLEDARKRLEHVRRSLDQVFSQSRQGSLLRSGINVVLAGRPNVGKSSLLNRLAGEERAIVTPFPGTTRDTVRETVAIEGVPINIVDTAGLREAADDVERLGIERTWSALHRADVALVVTDSLDGLTADDLSIVSRLPQELAQIHVVNKIDLAGRHPAISGGDPQEVLVSAKTGAGIDLLRIALLGAAGWQRPGESLFVARERHLRALVQAGEHLGEASRQHGRSELFAEELRLAQQALSTITGEFTADDLLGEIFSRFCIGK
jgi:tRNA modification GTPase